jgi:hypothetical protein
VGILITSGNRLGLRALGSGGRTALSSYDKIVRTLGQSMGPEHVALFAEPSLRGPAIDWYSNFDAAGAPTPIRAASPSMREAARARLEGLVNDISAKAAVLQQSDREGDRILGEMLQYALEVPSEDSVWLVGVQPVLTFWGHVRDQGQPAENPLRTMIQRRPPGSIPAPSAVSTPMETIAGLGGGQTIEQTAVLTPASAPRSILPAALWTIFTMLLVTIGVTLLHACGLGFTGAMTSSFLNYCPVTIDPRIDQERERQATLQAEYDDLIRQTELKRQACVLEKPEPPTPAPLVNPPPVNPPVINKEPPPVQPPPTPKKDDALVIPNDKKSDDFDFLKGCWRSDHGITAIEDGKDTGKPIIFTYCFGEGGNGTRTIKYDTESKSCRGGLHAHREGDMLIIQMDRAECTDKSFFVPATDTCKPGDNGEARCDELSEGDSTPRITNHRFLKD